MIAATVTSSLPTWILVLMAAFASWRLGRGGGSSAVAELSKANEVLTHTLAEERQLHQASKDRLGAEIRDLRIEVAHLRERTDIASALDAWGEEYEQRAVKRHDQQIAVLNLIADRLGPDDERRAA